MIKMSKQIETEKSYSTIREFFEPLLDNKTIRIFHMNYYGQITAKSKTKPCRASIIIPSELDDTTNLKFLDNWHFEIIAIPINTIKELQEKKD